MIELYPDSMQKKEICLMSFLRVNFSQKILDTIYENIEFPLELFIYNSVDTNLSQSIEAKNG